MIAWWVEMKDRGRFNKVLGIQGFKGRCLQTDKPSLGCYGEIV